MLRWLLKQAHRTEERLQEREARERERKELSSSPAGWHYDGCIVSVPKADEELPKTVLGDLLQKPRAAAEVWSHVADTHHPFFNLNMYLRSQAESFVYDTHGFVEGTALLVSNDLVYFGGRFFSCPEETPLRQLRLGGRAEAILGIAYCDRRDTSVELAREMKTFSKSIRGNIVEDEARIKSMEEDLRHSRDWLSAYWWEPLFCPRAGSVSVREAREGLYKDLKAHILARNEDLRKTRS